MAIRRFLPRPLGTASGRHTALSLAGILLVGLAVFVGWPTLRYFESHESTDDAYVDGSIATVSSRVAGTVIGVDVATNWSVKQGEVMARLDPRDFQVKLDAAEARLAAARQQVDGLYADYASAQSALTLAEEKEGQARRDFERARKLRAKGVVSQESYDRAATGWRVARASRELATHHLQQARAALGGSPDARDRYDTPLVHEAQAAVQAAKLDLGYTVITAPITGTVVNKHLEVGDRIQPGQPLMTLVPPPSDLYVTANFKETQLEDVRIGQTAEIRADIYPGTVLHAHVDSISMGTGAAFALLPPENAAGNWVKVVQRVPVKLVLDEPPPADKPLRIGLSVEAVVDVSDTHGAVLASRAQQSLAGQEGSTETSLDVPPLPRP